MLAAEGHEVHFGGLNVASALVDQGRLADVSAFAFFQDVPEVDAVAAMGGAKDDFYVYDAAGRLTAYFSSAGSVSTDLSTPDGWATIEAAIRAALP